MQKEAALQRVRRENRKKKQKQKKKKGGSAEEKRERDALDGLTENRMIDRHPLFLTLLFTLLFFTVLHCSFAWVRNILIYLYKGMDHRKHVRDGSLTSHVGLAMRKAEGRGACTSSRAFLPRRGTA